MKQRIMVGVMAVVAALFLAPFVAAAQSQGEVIGTIRLPARVLADGKPLPAGSYQVRLTAEEAKPVAAGTSGSLERWVEFVQRGEVKGREVASLVPEGELQTLQGEISRRPRPGATVVEKLKSGDYWRIWINRGGTHYLIHLPPA